MSYLPNDPPGHGRTWSQPTPAVVPPLQRSLVGGRGGAAGESPGVPPVAAPPSPATSVPAGDDRTAVLVTGSGGPAGVAVIRRLVALGHRVVGVDSDWAAAGGALAHVGLTVPRAGHPRFLDALLGVAAAHRVNALISTVVEELPTLTGGVARLTDAGVATWFPSLESVDLCCDKAAFARRLAEAGVPHPATTSEAGLAAAVPGPWIVKPRSGRGSRGVRALDTEREVGAALAADSDLIAQSRLTGREFTADALVSRAGALLTVVPRWREETKAGISVKGTTFESESVTAVVADALDAVGLTGPANVQGFVGADGAVTVVEINPRFSGGLPLTLAAGADVVGTYLAGILHPWEELPLLWFTPGVRMSRYFAETYDRTDGEPVADPCAPVAVTA
jgi:carbamoyl-phosphate synthase large subunit